MKKAIFGLFVGVVLVFSAPAADAQVLEFFAELPLQYSPNEGSADGVGGIVAGVRSFFLPVGLGFEKYTVDRGAAGETEVNFFNLFYASAFPIFELAVGIGVGSATDSAAVYKDADLFQWYFNAGFPFAPLFGVFVGIHNVSGTGKATTAGDPSFDFGGRMTAIGIRFGF